MGISKTLGATDTVTEWREDMQLPPGELRQGISLPSQPAVTIKSVSVVIPLLNEEDSIPQLYERLTAALSTLNREYEIIIIDDGSTDRSYEILKNLQADDPHLCVIHFRRNFGQTAAFSAGFDMARGDVIITIDADLQNDPADIPLLLDKIDEGYDVVSGWRINRQDRMLDRKLPSKMANWMISKMTGVELHDYGCSLKAYRSEVVKNIKLYGEMHRFIPALASWVGVRVAEVPVNHSARQFGKSKYGLGRVIRVFLDLLTVKFLLGFSTRPIQIFGLVGMLCLFIGMAIGSYLTVLRLFFSQPLADRPMLLLTILLVVLGVQFITMGLIGELIVRTYYESQNKPIYAVRNILRDDSGYQQIENQEQEVLHEPMVAQASASSFTSRSPQ
jgi:glycosyltransferase involved in cell wall biosynthesis